MNRWVLLIGAGIIAVLVAAQLIGRSPSGDSSEIARGARLYAQHCAVCHGANLEGQPNWQTQNADGTWPAPPHDATGHTWHHADDYLIGMMIYGGAAITGNPQNTMPAFNSVLTVDDAKAILAYIQSTWSDEIRAQQKNGH